MTSLSGARTSALVASDPYVPVARTSEVRPGDVRTVVVEGREIALFNVGGTFYALENRCPHQGAPLADGWIEDTTITCPWHAWCFDLRDGSMTMGGFTTVDTFDVRVDGETVAVSRTARPAPEG